QMYLWTSPADPEMFQVTSPSDIAGTYAATIAPWAAQLDATPLTGKLVLANDGTAFPNEGCSPFINAAEIAGNIAVVYRGSCTFVSKVANAQAAGAIAVIVINSVPGNPINMGGSGAYSIPALMIGQSTGVLIREKMDAGTDVMVSLKDESGPEIDGDFDNGIIVHEYGHGISNRLTGGPNIVNCLGNAEQMGEGWSDWFGLIMTMKQGDTAEKIRGIGTYAVSQPTDGRGIRPAPYSTDFSINPYTYDVTNYDALSRPHGIGFVWSTMLWDMTWNLIEEYGYDPDVYNGTGGNNLALQLVIDGLKLQPCSPGFIDMRDAILAADQLNNGGANQCYIWRAFAKRGLGYSAQQGSSRDLTDGVEAFDLPPSCEPNMAIDLKANPSPVTDGSDLTYTITVRNDTKGSLQGVQITDTLPANTTFVSATDGNFNKGVVKFKPVKLAEGQTIERTLTVKVNTGSGTTVLFSDDMENGSANWTATHDVGLADWQLSNKNPHSGTTSWFAVDPDAFSNQMLTLKTPVQLPDNALLRFWHDYNTEDTYDGGVVEITTNGGLSWEDLGSKMIQNGYNGNIPLANASTVQGPAFTGGSDGYIQTIVDLSSYSGQLVQIRFRMGSDILTGATGWYVDDVDLVVNPTSITNTAWVDSKFGGKKAATVETQVLRGDETSGASTLTASAQDNSVQLSLSSDKSTTGAYLLERSQNGRDFKTLATVAASDAGASQIDYTDHGVTPGKVYYYRAIPAGQQQATAEAQVQTLMADVAVRLYPNPANERVSLHFREQIQHEVQIEVVNALGQRMLVQRLSAAEAQNSTSLDVSGLDAGLYFVTIKTGDKSSTQSLVVKP
ncbi:MAG: M36 family metallopeptidase, partial [Bacteroidetes bacterium]|nr:M36 family metallopeptidase [Bacteroidota bacterium]